MSFGWRGWLARRRLTAAPERGCRWRSTSASWNTRPAPRSARFASRYGADIAPSARTAAAARCPIPNRCASTSASRGCSAPAAAFRSAHLLTMFDAASGLLVKMLAAPLRTHDLAQVAQLHPELQPGDVLVGDTAFAAFVHLALLFRGQIARRVRRPSTDASQLPPRSPTRRKAPPGHACHPRRQPAGAQAGTLRPNRPVPPAARLPAVDDGRAIRRAARNDRGARATLWDAASAAFARASSPWSPRCWTPRPILPMNWRPSTAAAGRSKPISGT